MATKIFTGADKAREKGFSNFEAMLYGLAEIGRHKPTGKISPIKVEARIDFGRWIADCPCGGAGYVDPSKPIFFCMSCGNKSANGDFLTVVFPKDRDAIEKAVLERPIVVHRDLNPVDAAMNAKPVIPGVVQNWSPGETPGDLRKQQKDAEETYEVRPGKVKDKRVKK